ncbi:MAG: oligosaccharide flippase family protein, partial [Pseudomonadota bacterium]|nr:oligosaccharide flippase family protein [Pseudomonadota bacterium]
MDIPNSTTRRNLIANYGGQGWSALINLAIIPVYVSYLGVESYGLIGILTIVLTCMTALDAGMTPTLNREMARFSAGELSTQSINDLLRSVEFLILGVVGCATMVGVLASGWLAAHWLGSSTLSHQALSRAIGLIVCVAGLRIVEGVYRGALLGAQRHVWLNAVSAGFATLRACGAIAVLNWVGPTIENFFVWQAIASLLAVAVLARATRKLLPRPDHRPRFKLDALVSVKGFASGVVGTSVLSILLTQVDKLLLAQLLSLKSFGYFTIGFTVANSLYQLVNPVAQTYYPRLAELVAQGDEQALSVAYHRGAQLLAVALVPAAMLLIFFGHSILWLWTADSQLASLTAPLLALLAAGCLCNGLVHIPYMLQLAS